MNQTRRILRPSLLVLLLVDVFACGVPGTRGGGAAIRQALGSEQPNVILVTIDTLRADYLGSYGSKRVETPHLDRLAREGARFTNAATTVPFTLPAHSSIMTGTYPPYHGVRENVGYALGEDVPTLAATLAEAGYHTAGFVSAFVLDSRWGIGRGFEHYDDEFDTDQMQARNMGSVQRDGAETLDAVLGWLDDRPAGPFFLWMHLFDPHDPYTPPEPYASRYRGRPYAGEVAYTDSLIGRFRDELEQRDLLDSSLLVLTGDHGEGLGDHGEAFHGYFVYESTVHVPLIIRAPGIAAGRVIGDAVSHIDLLPTILEVANVLPPRQAQGRSLVPLLLDEPDEAAERTAYTESYYALLHYGWAPLRSLRNTRYKFIDAPRPELYELEPDPGENRNLADERAATAFEFEQRLDQLVAGIEPQEKPERAAPDIDEDTLRQLRALGYIAGRGKAPPQDDSVERADPKDKIQLHQLIMSAQSEIGHGDETAAETLLRQALASDAEILDANQMLANILAQRGEHEAALPYFGKALEIDPEHEESLFGLANAYRRLGRPQEALIGFQRLLDLNPTDSKAVIGSADLLVESGRLADAAEALRNAFDSGKPVPPMLYNKYGEILMVQGRAGEAESWFERAAEANDELAQPLFNLAVVREERGQVPRAMELYRQAIERSPSHFQAQFNLGRLEGRMGRLDRQIELYGAALDSNPDFARGYFLLAELLMDNGRDMDRAEQLAREGIERDPEHSTGPLGYYVLADILNRKGHSAEAREAARRGREIQGR